MRWSCDCWYRVMATSETPDVDWQVWNRTAPSFLFTETFYLKAIKTLVFGAGVKENVFDRWLQPLRFNTDFWLVNILKTVFLLVRFSSKEPCALLQHAGGPCAVLAPLQVSSDWSTQFNTIFLLADTINTVFLLVDTTNTSSSTGLPPETVFDQQDWRPVQPQQWHGDQAAGGGHGGHTASGESWLVNTRNSTLPIGWHNQYHLPIG